MTTTHSKTSGLRAFAAAIMALGVAGCAAAPDRSVAAETATCYATIGDVDCYTTPEPDRHPTGTIANVGGTNIWGLAVGRRRGLACQ